jgi:4-hydroxy-tetrahydrodipicolinate synthase
MPLHEIFTRPGLVGAKYGMSLLDMCGGEGTVTPDLTDGTKQMRAARSTQAC